MASKQWAVVPHDGYMSDETPPIQIIDGDGNTVACNTTFYPTAITAEHAATIVAAVNQRAEMQARIDELEKALLPFAEAAEVLDDDHLDFSPIWETGAAMGIDARHLRAALSVLSADAARKEPTNV